MKLHPIMRGFVDLHQSKLEVETLKIDLKTQIDRFSGLIRNEREVAVKGRKICEQMSEGKYCLPGQREIVTLPSDYFIKVKEWSDTCCSCFMSMQQTQRILIEAYHKLQDPKTYHCPMGTRPSEHYRGLLKQAQENISPSFEKTTQLLEQTEHLARPLSLNMSTLLEQPGSLSDALVNQLSSKCVPVRFLAQADDVTDFPNVAAQQAGALPSGSGYAAGGPYHGYSGAHPRLGVSPLALAMQVGLHTMVWELFPPLGAPYQGLGTLPPQGAPYQGLGTFPPQGAPYQGLGTFPPQGGPYQGLVTLPSQGAPGGGSTPSFSRWMAPSCLDPLEFPYIWLMTLFSVLCAFYSDPGSLLEMLGALTLPGPLDILWIVVKSALIRSIKVLLVTYLMVLLYNFIQRVKSFFSKKKKE